MLIGSLVLIFNECHHLMTSPYPYAEAPPLRWELDQAAQQKNVSDIQDKVQQQERHDKLRHYYFTRAARITIKDRAFFE